MTYGNVTIYALKDPRDNRIFYVGRTKRSNSRLQQHLNEAKKFLVENQDPLERLLSMKSTKNAMVTKSGKNLSKITKILNILESGCDVNFCILDEWNAPTLSDANKLEEAWIAVVRKSGSYLTNYIYSHRMNPWWYGEKNKYYKDGWAKTPEEFIEKLKSQDQLYTGDEKTDVKKMTILQRKRLAKKNRWRKK